MNHANYIEIFGPESISSSDSTVNMEAYTTIPNTNPTTISSIIPITHMGTQTDGDTVWNWLSSYEAYRAAVLKYKPPNITTYNQGQPPIIAPIPREELRPVLPSRDRRHWDEHAPYTRAAPAHPRERHSHTNQEDNHRYGPTQHQQRGPSRCANFNRNMQGHNKYHRY